MMSAKNKVNIVFLLFLLLGRAEAYAGKRYWVGNGSNINWNSTGNWSTTSGSGSGASVPGTTDSVYFNSGGIGKCSINATVSVKRFEIVSGFTDSIKQNAFSITIGSSGMILSGGVFKGGSSGITDAGIFTLSGCNFISTSSILSITGNYTFSSGTFTHNNGEVKFVATSTLNGNSSFYDVTFFPASNSTFTISSGTVITVNNNLKTAGTAYVVINTGTLAAKGDITVSNTSTSPTAGGTATILVNGTGNQILTGATSDWTGSLCSIKINKPSGTLSLKKIISAGKDWTWVSGTVDASTDTSTVDFIGNNSDRRIQGNHSLYNVKFYCIAGGVTTNTIKATDTLTVLGKLSTEGGSVYAIALDSGVIAAKGNININNTYVANGAGTGTILINGSTNQTVTGTANEGEGTLPGIKIKKTGGTLYFKNILSVQGDWIYVSGTIDATTYNSTITFINNRVFSLPRTISGNHSLNNVRMYTLNDITSTDTLTILGELQLKGTFPLRTNGGTIRLKGDLTNTNSSSSTVVNTGLIIVCGTGDQTINGTSAELIGKLCSVTINKSSGTTILKNIISLADNCSWKLITGALDATTYNSTLVMTRGTKSIQGTQTLYNLTLDATGTTSTNNINSGDSITVNAQLKLSGTSPNIINTGVLNAKGNILVTNSASASGGGTGTINICGTGSQTLTGSGISISGCLCNVKVNKSSGTLNLASTISLYSTSTWTYIKGDVNSGTSSFNVIGGATINCGNTTSSMAFNHFRVNGGTTAVLSGLLNVKGDFIIDGARTLNTNSFDMSVGGNWQNSGTFTSGTSKITFNGSGNQYLITPTTTQAFYKAEINKPSGKLYCNAANVLNITNTLTLTKGVIAAQATHFVSLADDAVISGGSDSSYISGPMRKIGNDAFTFPVGDTLVSTGAYHPLTITAPGGTTDSYTAQYFSSVQTSGSTLQTDSLSSISSCEHWTLTRAVGTTAVIPSLGWNLNSCNADVCHKMRVAAWTGTQWQSLGYNGYTTSGNTGILRATSGIGTATLPLVIARTVNSSLYPTVAASSNDTICSGMSVVLSASGASTYSWSPSTGLSTTTGSSVTASPSTTITYSVTGTNSSGCKDTAYVTVTVLSTPSLVVSPLMDTISPCSGGATFTASGAATYSWSPSTGLSSTSGNIVSAHPTYSTTYTVIGTAASGCKDTTTAFVMVSGGTNITVTSIGFTSFTQACSDARFPPVICNYSGTACRDSSLTLTANGCTNPYLTYTWDMGDSTILTGTTVSHTYIALLNDTITLIVRDTLSNVITLTKYIPVTIYSCAPTCCAIPQLAISNFDLRLDTLVNLNSEPAIYLCENSTYVFGSPCYRPDTTNVSWVLSDSNPETADSTFTGNNFTVPVTQGTFTLTLTTFGSGCDTASTSVTIHTIVCLPVCSDCIGSFAPAPGKKYLLSAWVKEEDAPLSKTSYTFPRIVVSCPSVTFSLADFTPSGGIIDGWQRIEKEFTIPANATDLHIELKCTTGNCFFDDIRVFPFDGSMKSYVYDPVTMRLSAELDERNYATFYEYDEDGKLVRVKKETEKGIMTIQENRNKIMK